MKKFYFKIPPDSGIKSYSTLFDDLVWFKKFIFELDDLLRSVCIDCHRKIHEMDWALNVYYLNGEKYVECSYVSRSGIKCNARAIECDHAKGMGKT